MITRRAFLAAAAGSGILFAQQADEPAFHFGYSRSVAGTTLYILDMEDSNFAVGVRHEALSMEADAASVDVFDKADLGSGGAPLNANRESHQQC